MNKLHWILERHMTRPASCGPVSSDKYLKYLIIHSQLWRFPEHLIKPEDIPPIVHEPYVPTKLAKPRPGDYVEVDGDTGVIVYIDREDEMVKVNVKGEEEMYSLDMFFDYESGVRRNTWHI